MQSLCLLTLKNIEIGWCGLIEAIGDYEQVCEDLRQMDEAFMTTQGKQLIETFEALREVARWADTSVSLDTSVGNYVPDLSPLQDLGKLLAALPDWITEE